VTVAVAVATAAGVGFARSSAGAVAVPGGVVDVNTNLGYQDASAAVHSRARCNAYTRCKLAITVQYTSPVTTGDNSPLLVSLPDTLLADSAADELISMGCASIGRNLTPREWALLFADVPRRPTCPSLPADDPGLGVGA